MGVVDCRVRDCSDSSSASYLKQTCILPDVYRFFFLSEKWRWTLFIYSRHCYINTLLNTREVFRPLYSFEHGRCTCRDHLSDCLRHLFPQSDDLFHLQDFEIKGNRLFGQDTRHDHSHERRWSDLLHGLGMDIVHRQNNESYHFASVYRLVLRRSGRRCLDHTYLLFDRLSIPKSLRLNKFFDHSDRRNVYLFKSNT